MTNDPWKQSLRELMDDYGETVSEDVWTEVEKRMSPPLVASARRWRPWAVAAVVAAVVAGGGLLLFHRPVVSPEVPVGTPAVVAKESAGQQNVAEVLSAVAQRISREAPSQPPLPSAPSDSMPETALPAATPSPVDSVLPVPEPTAPVPAPHRNPTPGSPSRTAVSASASSSRISLGLVAQNIVGQGLAGSAAATSPVYMSNSYMGQGASAISQEPGLLRRTAPMLLTDYEVQADHREPVALGLTVRYGLTDRLAVETGLVYTLLRSDFTYVMGRKTTAAVQRLHYVGLPLRLHDTWLRWHGLTAYGAAGVQADVNVAATVATEGYRHGMGRDRVQFGVDVAVGVQYEVLPRLNLYAEPGLYYHFDNGSPVQNIYKDRPLTLQLQLGLRVDLR